MDKVKIFIDAADAAISSGDGKSYQFGPVKFSDETDCISVGAEVVARLKDKYPGREFIDESTADLVAFKF